MQRLGGQFRGRAREGVYVMSRTEIGSCAERMSDEVVRLRRDFHQHPEKGFEEKRTARVIAQYLTDLGLEVKTGIAGTGVTGLLRGGRPGRTVLLRADMDALPLQEKSDTPYRSINDGVMHACGHDGHMAILLGAAALLAWHRSSLRGRVKFVFQPAEENLGGARLLIDEGILDDPQVDAAFGLHLINQIPYGYIGSRSGEIMASMDSFTIRVRGRGGHSAMPEGGVDAIAISARVVSSLQRLISREIPPRTPLIVNIGTIRGGNAPNIIADLVELSGTVRCLDEEIRRTIPLRMDRTLAEITSDMQGSHELEFEEGYPVTVNDKAMANLVKRVAGDVVGPDRFLEVPPTMASEDMSFYLQRVPGCFFFVGAAGPEGTCGPHHNPCFDFDERALTIGLKMMANLAVDFLEKDLPPARDVDQVP